MNEQSTQEHYSKFALLYWHWRSGAVFGELGAMSNQGIKQIKIGRAETEVSCNGNTGCEYTVNGKKFEPR